ncbi:BppU family phage baseplate upper protein [Clostridium novyi]|uniref:BppU family phage baseplate upper protein n=1 Tax=Clostridium novyi TaxID=1542 RepID=UPI00069F48F8|nr:BppU family phage baseplate upper protein [Clostridium novyi]
MDKVFNLKIDTKNKNITTVTGLKQFDNNSILNITLLQNSLALDLSNCTVRLNFLREDERILLYMATVDNGKEGKVSIKLSPEVLEKTGNIKADISVFDSNLLKITSATFNIKVNESIYSNDYYLRRNEFDIMQAMYSEEEKRLSNEKGRVAAEQNRVSNETLRKSQEDTRQSNENKRSESETLRIKKETERQNKENNRIEAEKLRLEKETERISRESYRIEAEQKREQNELSRIKAEQSRIESENIRITTEKDRNNSEDIRIKKETERISNEEKRVQAENKRNEDEHIRIEAENKRNEDEHIRIEAENKRNEEESNRLDQEKIRIESEKTRVEAEDKRKISENTRVDNELGRITYEAERATNEKIRIQSELNRVENEKLRSEAEYKRLEAEKIRVKKEAERINSESKRLKNEQLRQTNETSRVEEWNKIKNTFKDNAPGDMKSIIYDKNGNGKVDIAELAESVEWENVKNKPNFDEIGKVKSVNCKTGAIELKAEDIKTKDGASLEKFKEDINTQYEDFTNEIGNIKDLKTTNKDNLVSALNEVFTSADNGKKSIYNSIVGKKVTPKSKDFKDLTDAITDIKLGQGNAQASEVLKGATFTNDSGVMQTGTMPNMGSKEIEPKIYSQELGKGYYEKVKLKGINDLDNYTMKEVVKTIAPKIKDDLPSIIQSAGILPFKTWSWKGDSYYGNPLNKDVPYKSMKVPFEIKILFTKCDGYKGGGADGVITQTWVDKDFFKTTIGEHFIFIPQDLVHYGMAAQNNFNYIDDTPYHYYFSEFKIAEDKQTINFPNGNATNIEIYALGW